MKKKLPAQLYKYPVFSRFAGFLQLKVLFMLLLLLSFQNGSAQLVEVLNKEAIIATSHGEYFHPVFSPSSDYLLCTDFNYKGLKQITLTDEKVKVLTDAAGAGYRVSISDDGNAIMHRNVQMVKNRKFTALDLLTISTGKTRELIAPTREIFTPAFSGSEPFFVKGTKLNQKSVPAAKLKPVIQIEDRKMVIYSGSERRVFTPNGENESYIWPSFSPEGNQIVYTVAGKGTFTSTIDGKNIQSLGKLSAPKWLNNNIVIGMDDKYFGQELISSEIIAVSADGKIRQTLATDKAIYPAASSDGRKIAYSNNEGKLFILNINIK